MIIRDFSPGDVPAARTLLEQLGYPLDEAEVRRRVDRVLATAGHRIIVAVVSDRPVGLLHVFERPALEKGCEAVVQALVVSEAHRSSGIGEALMRAVEAWAESRRLDSVALYTRADRDRARAFYERIGYHLKGTSHLMGRGRSDGLCD